ncbi:MAG: hypothetical protein IKE01_06445 [Clostridia bacterium]|nr:hypothetical protein [Clostridia bacterium]
MKEVIITTLILFAFLFVIPVLMHKILYIFAKVTYRAHKPVKKITNVRQKYVVVYDIDWKNKTLQEGQAEKLLMKRIIGGI